METLNKPPEIVNAPTLTQGELQPPVEQPELFNQGQLFDLSEVRHNDDRTSAVVAEKIANGISRIGAIAEKVSGRINNGANWLKNRRTASQVGEDALNSAKETYQVGREKAIKAGRTVMASAAISKWYVKERGQDIKGNIAGLVQTARERKQQRIETYKSKWQSTKETLQIKSNRARLVGRAAMEISIGAGLITANKAVTGANNAIAEAQSKRAERLFQKSVDLAEAADKRKNRLPKAS